MSEVPVDRNRLNVVVLDAENDKTSVAVSELCLVGGIDHSQDEALFSLSLTDKNPDGAGHTRIDILEGVGREACTKIIHACDLILARLDEIEGEEK